MTSRSTASCVGRWVRLLRSWTTPRCWSNSATTKARSGHSGPFHVVPCWCSVMNRLPPGTRSCPGSSGNSQTKPAGGRDNNLNSQTFGLWPVLSVSSVQRSNRWQLSMIQFRRKTEQCDVADKGALESYRTKLQEWDAWLNEDDNAIWHQIHGLAWKDATYHVLNGSRALARPRSHRWASHNTLIAEFVDDAWLALMILGIGELTDCRNDVVSIARLLNDMEKTRHLLSREHFVCHDGVMFDPAEAARLHWKEVVKPNLNLIVQLTHLAFSQGFRCFHRCRRHPRPRRGTGRCRALPPTTQPGRRRSRMRQMDNQEPQ